ncbi:hypothetical protein K523DRAFT_112185 [Schizophyllum commune Tattone D]|nr:hypothetical protein K523DRAFT_112185 [Schizophyllum commune Tattone D]
MVSAPYYVLWCWYSCPRGRGQLYQASTLAATRPMLALRSRPPAGWRLASLVDILLTRLGGSSCPPVGKSAPSRSGGVT